MLKIVVLQKLYNLSDQAVAYEMTNRFDFMRFLRIYPGNQTPEKKHRLGF